MWGNICMEHIRKPEEILAYRTLNQILAGRPRVIWSVSPSDSTTTAVERMAEKKTGFLLVLDKDRLAGVVSERDVVGHVVLPKKPPEATPVADIMVGNVITVSPTSTFAECLKLMHDHNIRYLPVVDAGKPVAVISIRDLLREAVTHHSKIIVELERERLTMFTSTA
jgi:signal-transduction protein with cAMP-binding, CBS, and nucleotidyltransferase domain